MSAKTREHSDIWFVALKATTTITGKHSRDTHKSPPIELWTLLLRTIFCRSTPASCTAYLCTESVTVPTDETDTLTLLCRLAWRHTAARCISVENSELNYTQGGLWIIVSDYHYFWKEVFFGAWNNTNNSTMQLNSTIWMVLVSHKDREVEIHL